MKYLSVFKAVMTAAALAAASVTTVAVIATPAAADVAASKALVDAAKAQGIVGEESNGYLGYVTASADPALKAAIDEINAGRRDVFAQAAAKNGVPIEAAGQSAFANSIFPNLPAGYYYQDASGAWVKK
ncbi:MAG: YdbL family protein [Asticcacaulis sp.]